jgi:hypothetical protein
MGGEGTRGTDTLRCVMGLKYGTRGKWMCSWLRRVFFARGSRSICGGFFEICCL